jgi:hypothetical protein
MKWEGGQGPPLARIIYEAPEEEVMRIKTLFLRRTQVVKLYRNYSGSFLAIGQKSSKN